MKKAITQILSGNILSKGLGLLREILMSKYFGTGEINGAYRIAQSGTLVPINFMTSDSLNSAFIPLYKKYLLEDRDKAETFKWCMFLVFMVISILIFSILFFFSDYWVSVLAPGINNNTKDISISLLKIMAICCPFYLCSALMNYVSMAHDDFKPMSMRNPVQNIGMLIGVVLSFYLDNYLYLAWGFTGSYIYFSIWSLCRKKSKNLFYIPNKFKSLNVKSVMGDFWRVLRPLLILPIILQGNITLERALSSLIGLDAISSLDYAKFITETVIFFLSVPIAFAGLSAWVGLNIEVVREKLQNLYIILVVIGTVVSSYIFLYARDIIILLFQRGAFNEKSVETTAYYLQGMCIGLWAQVIGYVFLKALSAQLKNKQVLISMAISLFGNAIINIVLYKYWGAFGIGVGCSVYGILLLLMTSLYLRIQHSLWKPMIIMSLCIALCSFIKIIILDKINVCSINLINVSISSFIFLITSLALCFAYGDFRRKFIEIIVRK